MKRIAISLLLATALFAGCDNQHQEQQVTPGRLDIYQRFTSPHFEDRKVLVWLPEEYNTECRYAVLYMHDAQMLFDEQTSWNKKSWNVDAVASMVQKSALCRPFIVVGIENHPQNRLVEYMPEKALDYIPNDNALLGRFNREDFIADEYLKFIVDELKPLIDSKYSTLTDASNTAIMGSSMGGLISLYALCEYPDVFGSAGCLSTHTPTAIDDIEKEAPIWSKALRDYLNESLPEVGKNRVYMDCGDKTIDAIYPPYQAQIDSLFTAKGWQESHFVSLFFEGAAHDESSWNERLDTPLTWMLGADEK